MNELLAQTDAINNAAHHVSSTWSGAVLVIILLTIISMAWWFIFRLWGKEGIVTKGREREEVNKDRMLAVMEGLGSTTAKLTETQRASQNTCATHVDRLDKLVQVSEDSCATQREIADFLRINAEWHSDPANPRNVLSVHASIRDLAEAGQLFVATHNLPSDVHDQLLTLFQRIRSRAEQNGTN